MLHNFAVLPWVPEAILARFPVAAYFGFVGLSEKSDTRLSVPCVHDAGLTMDKSRKRSRERRYDSLTSILQLLPYPYRIDLLISWL